LKKQKEQILAGGCASLLISPTDRMMIGDKYAEMEKQKADTGKDLSI